ncbi:MAG: MATE family efflux transporter [Candidatus Binatia bacterium]|nr:MAG: MATE family efflux transporter [Candidatus Binatia bacterium]
MDGDPASSLTVTVAAGRQAATSRPELLRIIWTLAWPVIVTLLLESLVGLVDTLMVGRLGANAVAAVGVGAQILNSVSIAMTAVGTGTLALVARAVGAGQRDLAERVVAQSLLAAFVLSCLCILPVMIFAREIVGWFGVQPEVRELGAWFTRLVMLSIPQSAALFVIGSALRAAGDTRTPLWIGALVNIINVIGNYVLIFGVLGFPALGVRGSALATVVAFSVGMVFGLGLLFRGRLTLRLEADHFRPHIALILRVLRIGYPAAAEQLLMQVGFFIYLVFAAGYGTSAVAAYFIGVRILALSFLPGYGFAAAAAALVGQNLGAKQPQMARRSGWESNRMAVYLMSACGILIVALARPIASAFVDDPEVIRDTVLFIWALGVSQPFMAIDFTLGGALRGAGDTRFPLLTVFVGFYGCRLGCAYMVSHVMHWDLQWLWFSLVGDYIARAVLKAWRFRSERWQQVVV